MEFDRNRAITKLKMMILVRKNAKKRPEAVIAFSQSPASSLASSSIEPAISLRMPAKSSIAFALRSGQSKSTLTQQPSKS
jgi:hypothetical protein